MEQIDTVEPISNCSDLYKDTHWMQYPPHLTNVYSYFESRGSVNRDGFFDETIFFGLQMYLKKYLVGRVITQDILDNESEFLNLCFGFDYFNREGFQKIVDDHDGNLPIEIRAVPEGTRVPNHNVLMTVVNTDPDLPFVTNYVETILSNVWYPITVATLSYNCRQLIDRYAKTVGERASIIHLNDFGLRGCTCPEQGGIGGCAHLAVFSGTDNKIGIRYAQRYYGATGSIGLSANAAEHSTVTAYGRENEAVAYKTIIENTPNEAVVSIVSDSYDIYNAVENIFGDSLREYILSRDGKVVIRPDSGDPAEVSLNLMRILYAKFGGTINDAGYMLLNPKIGLIYGDGISYDSIDRILDNVVNKGGFAPSNLIFGMGASLVQRMDRDTFKFAFKCSAAKIANDWYSIYKDPVTDNNKRSKRGKLKLIRDNTGCYKTVQIDPTEYEHAYKLEDRLVPVFKDGKLLKDYSFAEIRERINAYF